MRCDKPDGSPAVPCTNCRAEIPERMWKAQSNLHQAVEFYGPQYRSGQSLSLLTLPPEIRDRIWCFVFSVQPSRRPMICPKCRCIPRQDHRVEISHAPHKAASRSVLSALLVCRDINREAGHIFYSLNILSLSSPAALYHFLTSIGTRQRESVTSLHVDNLTISHWTTANIGSQAFALLSLCPRLSTVYIDFAEDDITGRTHLEKLFQHDYSVSLADYESQGESRYEEYAICKIFYTLSKQRNIEHVSIRAVYADAVVSNREYADYWMGGALRELPSSESLRRLRELMRSPGVKTRTRLQRDKFRVDVKGKHALQLGDEEDPIQIPD